jgi:hypothetical protein
MIILSVIVLIIFPPFPRRSREMFLYVYWEFEAGACINNNSSSSKEDERELK